MNASRSEAVAPGASFQSRIASGALPTIVDLVGRVLLSVLFLMGGIDKIAGYAGTARAMAGVGLPGELLPIVIATEILGPIAIVVGWQTRVAAFLLAGYTVLTAIFFHSHLADQVQSAMFFKNLAIAGGFLVLVANGAGALSLDRRFATRGH